MEAALDRVSAITIETVDGRREHLFSDPEDDAYGNINSLVLEMDGGFWDAKRTPDSELLVELGTEGYYRSSFYRLGSLRLIEAPLYACSQAVEAMFREDGPATEDEDSTAGDVRHNGGPPDGDA
jgi:hypothetical protein